jgi:hypothetical protein
VQIYLTAVFQELPNNHTLPIPCFTQPGNAKIPIVVTKWSFAMGVRAGITLTVLLLASAAAAQSAAPSYQADPGTYKLIFEDPNYRVIAATWKKGTTDKPHSHPVAFVAYALDDCALRIHNPDGTTRDISNKAGAATSGLVSASHTAENIGPADCHSIFVEHK